MSDQPHISAPAAQALRTMLSTRYQEPQRHYHSLTHIETLLRLADEYRALAQDVQALDWAIWFHDAVYDPTRAGNEAASAELAQTELTAIDAEPRLVSKVCRMVLATTRHEWADGDSDTALFLDLDLSTLGLPQTDYDAYSVQVRAEYAWVPDAIYCVQRAQVLQRFLARPQLYFTQSLRDRFEAQARINLQREIATLTST